MDELARFLEAKEALIKKIKGILTIETLKKLEERLKDSGHYDEELEKIVLTQKKALEIKKRFQDREPIVQHVIYTCLKKGNFDRQDIIAAIEELGYNREEYSTKSLIQRAENFLNSIKDNPLAINLVVNYYETAANQRRISDRLNKAKVKALSAKDKVEPIRLHIDDRNIFDRFKEMHTTMSDEFRALINRMLDEKVLPSDPKGAEIIRAAGLNGIRVAEYFNLLNQIAIQFDFKDREREMAQLLQRLNDSEIIFLCDLSRDGIEFGSDQYKEMLNNRLIRSDAIIQYLYDPNSVKLNESEVEFINELATRGIRSRNAEFEKLLKNRIIRPEMLQKYFDILHQIKNTVEDSKGPLVEERHDEQVVENAPTEPVIDNTPVVENKPLEPTEEPEVENVPTEPVVENTPIEPTVRNNNIRPTTNAPTGLQLRKKDPEERLLELYLKIHRIESYDEEFLQMVRDGRADLLQFVKEEMNSQPLLRENREEVEELLRQVEQKRGKKERFFDRVKKFFGKKKNKTNTRDINPGEDIFETQTEKASGSESLLMSLLSDEEAISKVSPEEGLLEGLLEDDEVQEEVGRSR